MTRNLTWTFGLARYPQFQSREPARRGGASAGSFDAISHDVNQPLNACDPDRTWAISSRRRRWRFCSPEPRLPGSSRRKRCCEPALVCSAIILPGSVADLVGVNPPYSKTFQGGLLGTVGGTAIAPGVPNSAIDATVAANQTFTSGFAQGQLSCASPLSNPATCLAARGHHGRSGRQASCAVLHAVELGLEHQIRQHRQSAAPSMWARARSTSPT